MTFGVEGSFMIMGGEVVRILVCFRMKLHVRS